MDNTEPKKGSYDKSLYTEEAKKERFQRVAERRVNRILEYLRLLGNTSNRTLYLYSDRDVDRIFNAIEERLIQVRGKFKKSKFDEKFRL